MSLKESVKNSVLRSLPKLDGKRHGAPNAKPLNVIRGGTTGGVNNYGVGRGPAVFGSYTDLMQWRAGRGTSQDRYGKTRLPGDY